MQLREIVEFVPRDTCSAQLMHVRATKYELQLVSADYLYAVRYL